MYKRLLLTSTVILSTLTSVAAPTVVSAATTNDQTQTSESAQSTTTQAVSNSNDGNKSNVIAGSKVKSADDTVAHSTNVQAAASSDVNNALETVVQAASTSATSAEQQNFLSMAAPMAQQIASKYNLYASVMLAQAILESAWGTSDLATQGNNLFGIKGDYNGSYVSMPTSEWSASQGWYQIYANFRKYPSYLESFNDNGNKLRNGLDWNSSYYSGTWKENTSSYKDATAWLQGRYATAPNYASSLNNLIETYNLTQYDSNTQNATQAPSDSMGTLVANNPNSFAVPLVAFGSDGTPTKANRGLANNSAWATDQSKDYNGHTYYRVSTNEWVMDTYATLK